MHLLKSKKELPNGGSQAFAIRTSKRGSAGSNPEGGTHCSQTIQRQTKSNTVFPLSQYCYQTQGTPKGPVHPVARATPYPEVTEQFCRLPSHAFSCLTRGCSPWRPAAVVGTDENQSCVSPRDFSRLVSRTSDNAW